MQAVGFMWELTTDEFIICCKPPQKSSYKHIPGVQPASSKESRNYVVFSLKPQKVICVHRDVGLSYYSQLGSLGGHLLEKEEGMQWDKQHILLTFKAGGWLKWQT